MRMATCVHRETLWDGRLPSEVPSGFSPTTEKDVFRLLIHESLSVGGDLVSVLARLASDVESRSQRILAVSGMNSPPSTPSFGVLVHFRLSGQQRIQAQPPPTLSLGTSRFPLSMPLQTGTVSSSTACIELTNPGTASFSALAFKQRRRTNGISGALSEMEGMRNLGNLTFRNPLHNKHLVGALWFLKEELVSPGPHN